MDMTAKELHVVFGAGQIGPPLARKLRDLGHDVRIVRRSSAATIDGITVAAGDAMDAAFTRSVTQGATAIYNCMNPPYSAQIWSEQLPRLAMSLIGAASANHARLVVLDNLYMFGRMNGAAMNEQTPIGPISKKGEVRTRVAAQYSEAHAAGTARVVSGRAPDFFGPGGDQTNFGSFFWEGALKGGKAQVLVNPDMPHAFAFTHDVAEGLATLGTASDDVTGQWWMLPSSKAMTIRELGAHFSKALGRDIKVERVPALIRRVLPLFMAPLREFPEMSYQWEAPYLVDDATFRARFGVSPTPLPEAAALTVAWAREKFSAK
jgi:nucleoside-diphosphate-sugar epimerase